ncbi:uncharacterized protein LOC129766433 [Toxorhynchites rutilus septentrionalis]|uniref:uncharacterized protein LOC129766433 n=1 Tax=Toxorhynchites rutilus septentrionalis TaxID=329112 RepID=UPI00247A2BA4|nr:uncharacterized protein LOC129766433 [Toxorhynchites rutilus septentrionalis]
MDQLLKAGEKFEWSPACQKSFDRFREFLQSPFLLTRYNPKFELVLSADASSVGLGARIVHKFPDGTVKATCHASRNLTAAESNYSQIEKEGLALMFTVTKFHRMIFGRRFVLETEHKHLLAIFGSKKGIPTCFRTRGHPVPPYRHVRLEEDYVLATIEFESTIRSIMNQSLEALPVLFKTVQTKTRIDETLQQVIKHVNTTWPTKKTSITDPHIQEFFQCRESLSITADCLMYGERLVLPSVLRKKVLVELHKGLPVSNVIGPLLDMYAYTKWPEVVRTNNITSAATIRILRDIFVRFGSPEILVTDNRTQFTSEMFEAYCEASRKDSSTPLRGH